MTQSSHPGQCGRRQLRHPRTTALSILTAILNLALLTGCAGDAKPLNPSFPVTGEEAQAALNDMAKDPVWLPRPVVIIGGYFDPGLGVGELHNYISRAVVDPRTMAITMGGARDYEHARSMVIEQVQAKWPSDDPHQTIPVDVVALSMGNLVARYAALDRQLPGTGAPEGEPHHPRRLQMVRYYSIAGPHRGSAVAVWPTTDPIILSMRPDAAFIDALNQASPRHDHEAIYYVRLKDRIVGPHNAAPPGQTAYWLPMGIEPESHLGVQTDPRILADIARRLRHEKPFTRGEPTPLPNHKS